MDDRLIETVARVLESRLAQLELDDGTREAVLDTAEAVIAAINASGTHWVAPRVATEAMIDAAADALPPVVPGQLTTVDWLRVEYAAQRDAYIAEHGGGDG